MNILIFSWRGLKHPNAGGAEIVTHEHAKAWVKGGHSVTIFTSTFSPAKPLEEIDHVVYIRKGNQALQVHWQAFLWYVFKRKQKFDLIIDQFHGIPFFTPLYVRQKKLAFIHEVTKELWTLNPWKKPFHLIPQIVGTYIEPFIFRTLYQNIPFLTVSESTRDDLLAWNIRKEVIYIIHNGVMKPKMIPHVKKENKKTLIFLGSLAKDKGIEKAITIFSLILKQKDDYQLWIVGKGEETYSRFLISKSKQLRIENNVTFWGYVNETKKYELLKRAHLLINPSIREGWGLVVLEAALMKTPTIAFNVPGLKDAIINGQTGILIPKDHDQLFVNETLMLLENKKRYQSMQNKAHKRALSLSWEKSTKQSLQLIENIYLLDTR